MSEPKTPSQVFVGRKSIRTYFDLAERILSNNTFVVISARGNLISKAILVAERVRRDTGANLSAYVTVTQLQSKDGKTRDVPLMEITLKRKET